MTCQFNPPGQENDRSHGAVFLRDPQGNIWVAHNGNVGGGKTGVGKHAFLDYYAGEAEEIEWPDGVLSKAIIIGRLDSPTLLDDLADYVHDIARFKRSVNDARKPAPPKLKFNPEFFGPRRKYELTKAIQSVNRHGYIVKGLRQALAANGYEAYNTANVDLFIAKKSRMTHVFDVKIDAVRDSVYKAIGQVMLHGAFETTAPKRIVVMPAQVTTHTQRAGCESSAFDYSRIVGKAISPSLTMSTKP